jgi:hypothetical protein
MRPFFFVLTIMLCLFFNQVKAELINSWELEIGKTYELSRVTPLMPHYDPVNKLSAVTQMQELPVGSLITIQDTNKNKDDLWYRVKAITPNNSRVHNGWINNVVLLNTKLLEGPKHSNNVSASTKPDKLADAIKFYLQSWKPISVINQEGHVYVQLPNPLVNEGIYNQIIRVFICLEHEFQPDQDISTLKAISLVNKAKNQSRTFLGGKKECEKMNKVKAQNTPALLSKNQRQCNHNCWLGGHNISSSKQKKNVVISEGLFAQNKEEVFKDVKSDNDTDALKSDLDNWKPIFVGRQDSHVYVQLPNPVIPQTSSQGIVLKTFCSKQRIQAEKAFAQLTILNNRLDKKQTFERAQTECP